LTEVRLPRVDGWELTELLKLDYPDLQVVYLSSFFNAEIRSHIRSSRVVVLENPFRPDHLQKVVRDVLQTRRMELVRRLRPDMQAELPGRT
jgi:CheY-like chemotaxis protein